MVYECHRPDLSDVHLNLPVYEESAERFYGCNCTVVANLGEIELDKATRASLWNIRAIGKIHTKSRRCGNIRAQKHTEAQQKY